MRDFLTATIGYGKLRFPPSGIQHRAVCNPYTPSENLQDSTGDQGLILTGGRCGHGTTVSNAFLPRQITVVAVTLSHTTRRFLPCSNSSLHAHRRHIKAPCTPLRRTQDTFHVNTVTRNPHPPSPRALRTCRILVTFSHVMFLCASAKRERSSPYLFLLPHPLLLDHRETS